MCKQVPSYPHPYQKIPDICLLRSVPLPICTFLNCLFLSHRIYSMRSIQTFCVHLLLLRYLLLSCSIVLFGLTTTRLNKTTTTTTTTTTWTLCFGVCYLLYAMQVEDYSSRVQQIGGIGNSYYQYVIDMSIQPQWSHAWRQIISSLLPYMSALYSKMLQDWQKL